VYIVSPANEIATMGLNFLCPNSYDRAFLLCAHLITSTFPANCDFLLVCWRDRN